MDRDRNRDRDCFAGIGTATPQSKIIWDCRYVRVSCTDFATFLLQFNWRLIGFFLFLYSTDHRSPDHVLTRAADMGRYSNNKLTPEQRSQPMQMATPLDQAINVNEYKGDRNSIKTIFI